MSAALPGLVEQVEALQGLQRNLKQLSVQVELSAPFQESSLPSQEDCLARLTAGLAIMPGQVRPHAASVRLASEGLQEMLVQALPERAAELRSCFTSVVGPNEAPAFLDLVLANRGNELLRLCRERGLPEDLAVFVAVLLARPFRSWFATRLNTRAPLETWLRGYCPVCGHLPSLSLLDGKEDGRRYLWCLQCGTNWRYPRLRCAFCGNEDQALLAHHQILGEEIHHLQGCRICQRYLKEFRSLEARDQVPWDAVYLGTVELDLAAASLGLLRESPLIAHHEGEAPPLAHGRDPASLASNTAG